MDQASEHELSTGQIEPDPIEEHPRECLCTGCTTERALERGGRFDRDIATYLHHIKDLRELRVPRSTGGAGYKRAEVAGEHTVRPSPTVDKDAA